MDILLLGSGGREHALAWKIRQSKYCGKLFIAPGNAGTAQQGENINIGVNDFEAIKKFVTEKNIEMVIVGPEEPLVKGIYEAHSDLIQSGKLIMMAPSAEGAQLEGSKAFAKHFMQRHNIPTAAYAEFTRDSFEEGKKYISQHTTPVVLKADGLAAGKGVVIATTTEEALKAFEEMIIHQQFGDASSKVVIEEFLDGIELSVFVLTNGKGYKIIGHAKDYKRIGEGDTGLNTGGMGCVSPLPFLTEAFLETIEMTIIQPTISGLQKDNIRYDGFIFFGLIKTGDGPYVIEYNCRMGDPETEVVMPRLKNDIVELFLAVHNNTLDDVVIAYDDRACATVVAVSGGYPGNYQKGKRITFPQLSAAQKEDTIIFHAGTKVGADNNVVTSGGRVLAVSSFGSNIADAVQISKEVLKQIHFEGMNYRCDIGYEFNTGSQAPTA
jgi:phosphoribosylamine--glycine ligase